MPELPEVEAVLRRIRPRVRGRIIQRVQILRHSTVTPFSPADFSRKVRGSKILRIERRGKNLVFSLAPSRRSQALRALVIHLRMSGNVLVQAAKLVPPPGTSIAFQLNDHRAMILQDRRGLAVCRLLTTAAAAERLGELGVEPLSAGFTVDKLLDMARNSRSPVKGFLMDQRRIAGLGNIYSVEALFRAGIHPEVPASSLSPRRITKLHSAIVTVLAGAVKSAIRGYRRPGRFAPGEEFVPQVYGREGQTCRKCGSIIRRLHMKTRSTFYCPHCQRK